MDCSMYNTTMSTWDCELKNHHVPLASILLVITSIVVAFSVVPAKSTEKLETRHPVMWKVLTVLMIIPNFYADIMICRYIVNFVNPVVSVRRLQSIFPPFLGQRC